MRENSLRRRSVSTRSAEESLSATVLVRVPFHDADPAGVVWHGNYFRYFDTARCALLELFDYGYQKMEESGYVWPVIDTRVRFIQPAHFDQLIKVTATLSEWEHRLKIDYLVQSEASERLAEAYTMQAAVDVNTGELCLCSPPALLDRLAKLHKLNES